MYLTNMTSTNNTEFELELVSPRFYLSRLWVESEFKAQSAKVAVRCNKQSKNAAREG